MLAVAAAATAMSRLSSLWRNCMVAQAPWDQPLRKSCPWVSPRAEQTVREASSMSRQAWAVTSLTM